MGYWRNFLPCYDVYNSGGLVVLNEVYLSIYQNPQKANTLLVRNSNHSGYTGLHYWYYWNLSGAWLSGVVVSYQGPLADVTPPYEVLNYTGLYPGTYIFYFGVDSNMNGIIDLGDLIYDYVTVIVE